MLAFRMICAVLVATAMNWALGRQEAAALLEELPQMRIFGPAAAAVIGYVNLAPRQGWGMIVAVANGVWSGVLAVLLASFMFLTVAVYVGIRDGVVKSFDGFLNLLGTHGQDLLDALINFPLLVIVLSATAVAGLICEMVHWLMVQMRRRRENGD